MTSLPAPLTAGIEHLLTRIVQRSRSIIAFDTGGIALVDAESSSLILCTTYPEINTQTVSSGIVARAYEDQLPILASALEPAEDYPHDLRVLSAIALPLMLDGKVLGIFTVGSFYAGRLKEDDLYVLSVLGDQAALAIDAALAASTERTNSLETAVAAHQELTRLATSRESLDFLQPRICGQLARLAGAEACLITLWDRELQQPGELAGYGLDASQWQGFVNIPAERVLTSGAPALYHAPDDPIDVIFPLIDGAEASSVMVMPISGHGRKLGAVFLVSMTPGRVFSRAEASFLNPFIEQAGLIIDSHLLLEDIRNRSAQTALLLETAALSASSQELTDMLQWALDLIRNALRVEKGAFLFYSHLTNSLQSMPDSTFGFEPPGKLLSFQANDPENQIAASFMSSTPYFANSSDTLRIPQDFATSAGITNLLVAPLRIQNNRLGVFLVANRSQGTFTSSDAELVSAIGTHIAASYRNIELRDDTEARLRETESLQRIAVVTSATLDMDDMLLQAMRETAALIGVEAGLFLTLDKNGRSLNVHRPSMWGIPIRRTYPEWPLDSFGHIIHAYHTGTPFLNNNEVSDPNLEDADSFGITFRNVITYPLNTRNRTLGTITLLNKTKGKFDQFDLELAHAIASQVAVSLESAQLFIAERERADLMSLVNQISQELSFVLDLPELLEKTVSSIHRLLGYEAVTILLLDQSTREVEIKAHAASNPDLVPPIGYSFSIELGVVGQAIRTQEIQYVPDVKESGVFFFPEDALDAVAACIAIPLRSGDEILGVLDIASSRVGDFTETDRITIQTLAVQVATSIKNAQLYHQAQRQAADQRFLREATVRFSRVTVLESLLNLVSEAATQAVDAACCATTLWHSEDKALYPEKVPSPSLLSDRLNVETQWDYPVLIEMLSAQKSIVLQPGSPPPALEAEMGSLMTSATCTHLLIPILQRRNLIGAIEIVLDGPQPIDSQSIAVLEGLAQQAGIAIENVRLIEELEQRAVELAKANQLKSEFLASISHELRTPMNSIIGFSEILLTGMYGDLGETATERIERILRNGRSLLVLIDDLLDISKIEAGKLELTSQAVSMAEMMQAVLYSAEDQFNEKNLAYSLDVPPDLPPVRADPFRLRQVITNLLSNAIKFTHEGSVTLRAGVEASEAIPRVWCSITDTGIGIAEDDQSIIFDEFRQVDGTTTRKYGGTGLGLAISKKLLRLMSGNIKVESKPGHGSTFTFWLPAVLPGDTAGSSKSL